MKSVILPILALGFSALPATAQTPPAVAPSPSVTPAQPGATQRLSPADAARVEQSRAFFLDAYRSGNVEAIMSTFHKDATYSGTLQPMWIKGYEEVREQWARFFASWPQRHLIFREVDIRSFAENVSIETGYLEMWMSRPDPREAVSTFIRYSITRVRDGDNWLIANMNVARLPGH